MNYDENEPAEKQLDGIAHYFASRWPWQIDFADADTGGYLIFLAYQKWKKNIIIPTKMSSLELSHT